MADPTVEIKTNLPDFKRQMARFSDELEQHIVRAALNAAGKVFKEAVIARAPIEKKPHKGHEPGTLRRAIYIYRIRNAQRGTVEMSVSFRKGKKQKARSRDAYFGRFLEGGWIPTLTHKRQSGRHARALHRKLNAGRRIERPFMRPAFNASKNAALAAFNAEMQKGIDDAERKL